MKSKVTKEDLINLIEKHQRADLVAKDLGISVNTMSSYIKKYDLLDVKPRGFYSKYKIPNVEFKIKQSEEAIAKRKGKFSGDKNPFFGKKHSEDTKKKMSKNHADFTGDKNPFRKACKKNPELGIQCSKKMEEFWANKTEDEKYDFTRHKNCIYEDISKNYWSSLIRGAEARNIELNITPKDIWDTWIKQDKKCKLTGIELNFKFNKEITASVDRIDSTLPYDVNNIQIIHKHINIMKWAHSQEYFIQLCGMVALYNI